MPPGFYGLNINPFKAFSSANASTIAATSVTDWRYPGGDIGETYNYSTNIRIDTGVAMANSIANFVTHCKVVGCRAILQLPLEINSPSTAAYFVSVVKHGLRFTPAYWELGNEPANWTMFGCSWADWSTCHGTNVTPAQFAALLPGYITAIRAVDASTPILALGGTGQGSGNDFPWIYQIVRSVGTRIAGVSLHSYANGQTSCSTLQCFYSGLLGTNSTSATLARAESAIRSACTSCASIGIFLTESGANSRDTVNVAYEESFDGAVWAAAEMQMALVGRAANIDWFAWDNIYPLSWTVTTESGLRPVYYFYHDVVPLVGNVVMNTTVDGGSGSLFALQTYSTSHKTYALELVNVDTLSAKLDLAGSGFPTSGKGTTYEWTNSTAQPKRTSWSTLSSFDVPPNSIVVLTVSGYAPNAPTSFNGKLGGTTVTLTWKNPSGTVTNDSLKVVTRCGSQAPVISFISTNGEVAKYVMSGLSPSTTYCLYVMAWDESVHSPLSAKVSFRTGN